MTRLTAEAPMCTWMVLSILASGEKTSSTDSVLRHGPMVRSTRETMNTGRSTVPAPSSGLMVPCTLVNSTITTSTEKVFTRGQTVVNTRANGEIIRCMVKVHSPGLTEENMLESTLMIRNKATESSFGPTVAATRETGKAGSNTAKVFMSPARAQKSSANGKTARESGGLAKMREPRTSDITNKYILAKVFEKQ